MDSFLIKATKDNIENINELENRIFSFGYEGSLTVEDLAKGMKTKLDLAKMAVSLFRVMKESLKLLKKCCEDYANKETSFGEKLERMGDAINHVKEKVDKLEAESTETKADFCSYKDALVKNVQMLSTETAINEQKIASTIDKAFIINQRDRSRNVIIYGLGEHENDDRDDVTLVKDEVIDYICEDLHESDI